ncbi:MAG: hypothetical protein Athens071426_643 [Parcubacteria group bacterium Athens0714_26]|nr:MAG: hypothetical protein Athens101426_514 [Parcubacteria group bacterium Athens1014_26]TSD01824.1 MAG: hypothetical protein Athens071426_643 [Parcubacteria group bacterium Athens0714_26]
MSNKIEAKSAVLPSELVLDVGGCNCNGDGCNADTGGCTHDASCGQDC